MMTSNWRDFSAMCPRIFASAPLSSISRFTRCTADSTRSLDSCRLHRLGQTISALALDATYRPVAIVLIARAMSGTVRDVGAKYVVIRRLR
jgi:hypothetical protein